MNAFSYLRASSIDTAVNAASRQTAYLAGGIDLLGELKEGQANPQTLVSITRIPGLDGIERRGADWWIGANTRLVALIGHAELAASLPGLAEAALEVGSPQIRNVATVGGNLAQHSRCWYYRHRDIQCLKNGGPTCYARIGEHRHHSIFSGNPCISPVVSNLGVALAVLDARIQVRRGARTLDLTIEDLYDAAWTNPLAHNSLRPGDLILGVLVPAAAGGSTYLQQSEKADFDWALVSCAAWLERSGGVVRDCRVALGAVAPIPYRSARAEASLKGKALNAETAGALADLLLADHEAMPQNQYKVPMARALIKRSLLKLGA